MTDYWSDELQVGKNQKRAMYVVETAEPDCNLVAVAGNPCNFHVFLSIHHFARNREVDCVA